MSDTAPTTPVAAPDQNKETQPALKAAEVGFEDYLAYRVAAAAKKEVLAYFGIATIAVSVLVTLIGWQEMERLIKTKYEDFVTTRAKAANERVNALQTDFENRIKVLNDRMDTEAEEHSKYVASLRTRLAGTSEVMAEIDLSSQIGSIRDQGPDPITVGFALAYSLQGEWKRLKGETIAVSPRSIYAGAKKYDNFPSSQQEGTSLEGGVKALQRLGAALESEWPMTAKQRPANVTTSIKISSFERLRTTSNIIQAIRDGAVVSVSLDATEDFFRPAQDGRVTIRASAPVIGGHAVTIVGWNEKTREFKFANMWGTSWGSGGFGFIRESDLAHILTDAYRLKL